MARKLLVSGMALCLVLISILGVGETVETERLIIRDAGIIKKKYNAYSGATRHPIPIQVATPFRLIPPWESDPFRHPLERM